jgi:hypothetical protein
MAMTFQPQITASRQVTNVQSPTVASRPRHAITEARWRALSCQPSQR